MYENPTGGTHPPQRKKPEYQENHQAQPWFVSDSKPETNINQKAKVTAKKTASVLFPLLGLTVLVSLTGLVVYFVTRMY